MERFLHTPLTKWIKKLSKGLLPNVMKFFPFELTVFEFLYVNKTNKKLSTSRIVFC
jgi:hypothetical protein